MYCVIQKVENKKAAPDGEHKKLKVDSTTWGIAGEPLRTKYYYTYEDERFNRPIKTAYKISIHKSYRENGKVKKKQWVICTIGYYEIADGWTWIGDHTIKLNDKLKSIGITEDELCKMVYEKLDPIIAIIQKDFKKTEEYKTKQKHDAILKKYRDAKEKFEKKYGERTYDYCYDIFGFLRNKDYLNELKNNHKAKQEYYKRSYYDFSNSNYNSNRDNSSSYFENKHSNYTEEEKIKLKTIYKVLALKFHPDMDEGNNEMMQLINKLKEDWEI